VTTGARRDHPWPSGRRGSQAASAASPFGPFGGFGNPFGPGPAAAPRGTTRGVVVAATDPGSPAARAGITSGDVITKIDGHATPDAAALSRQVAAHQPGQVVSVTFSTQNRSRTARVRLGQGPIS
jgi:S1-C subfamily serine protease